MPLVKRAIEPVFVCRSQLNEKIKNELEGVVVNSLSGLIRQLSSLSKHAENLFGELFNEANNIFQRSTTLTRRVGDLNKSLKQMDATIKEEVKVEDIISMTHFKSKHMEDQQILSRQTLPTAVYESYTSCHQPPALNDFTQYRDDGKEGLKFYTDPNYFYRLWVEAQNELLEKKKKREKKKRRRNRDNQPKKEIRVAEKKKFIGADVEFRDVVAENRSSAQLVRVSRDSNVSGFDDNTGYPPSDPSPENIRRSGSIAANKPSYAPPPPPISNIGQESPRPVVKPIAPPPPPPVDLAPMQQYNVPPPPPPDPMANYGSNVPIPVPAPPPPMPTIAPAPPPPPPPPMANIPAPPPPPPSAVPIEMTAPVAAAPPVAKPPDDPRNDLLAAIRLGKQLRKVEEQTQVEKKQQSHGNDVASILARRIAFELSDSESGSDDSGSDSDWDD